MFGGKKSKARILELLEENLELRQKLEDLSEEVKRMDESIQHEKDKRHQLKQEYYVELENIKELIKKGYDEKTTECNRLNSENEKLHRQIDELKKEIKTLSDRNAELTKQVEEKNNECNKLKNELRRFRIK